METGGEILIRIRNDDTFPGVTLNVQWHGHVLAKEEYQSFDDMDWVSTGGLAPLKSGSHEMAITFDRKVSGRIKLFLDGKMLANESTPLVASPKTGQKIWFNAQDWKNLDTGFRGSLNRFTMYADAVSPEEVGKPQASKTPRISRLTAELEILHVTTSPWALLFPCVIIMLFLLFITRRRKGLIRLSPRLGPAPCRANSKERSGTQAYPRYSI